MKVDVVDFLSSVIYSVSFSMITLTKTNHFTNWKCEEHDSVDTNIFLFSPKWIEGGNVFSW